LRQRQATAAGVAMCKIARSDGYRGSLSSNMQIVAMQSVFCRARHVQVSRTCRNDLSRLHNRFAFSDASYQTDRRSAFVHRALHPEATSTLLPTRVAVRDHCSGSTPQLASHQAVRSERKSVHSSVAFSVSVPADQFSELGRTWFGRTCSGRQHGRCWGLRAAAPTMCSRQPPAR